MKLSNWANDLRLGLRGLRRSPGFAALAITTLALAIGANVGIFSVVDVVLLDPLPFPDADRLVFVGASAPGSEFPAEFGVSAELFLQYREQSRLLEDASIYNGFTNTLRAGDRVERIWMSAPTYSLFTTLQVSPMLGRLPSPEDESVMLISHSLWRTWFGSDPDIVGKSYFAAGAERVVIGVMGPDFWFPDQRVQLWIPTVIRAEGITPGRFGIPMVARMAPGATLAAVREELADLARRAPERFGGSARYAELMTQKHRPLVRRFEEQILGDVRSALWVLLGAVGLVLLIACANVANLFTVRAERRHLDLAVRRALGARRRELVRVQMAEAVVIATLAGLLAVLLAWLSLPVFVRAAPANVPRLAEASLGMSTLAFTLVICGVSVLLCGMIPAIRASAPGLTRLGDAGGRSATKSSHRLRDGLVVTQTALALVLLIGAGLLVRSFWALRSVDPGYDTEDIFTFQIAPEGEHLVDGPSFARFHLDFERRIAAMPGVQSVGLVENLPLNEGVNSGRFLTEATQADTEGGALIWYTWADGNYFGTMGIDIQQGRTFAEQDHLTNHGNVLVSRSAADLLWPGQEPVGQRVKRRAADDWDTVVGVVEDVLQYGFRELPEPMIYFPLAGREPDDWVISSPAYVVKTTRAEEIGPEIRAAVREVSSGAPMYRMFTMAGLADDSMVNLSFTMLTLSVASGLALVLGAVGLFGVLSYVVASRTREIGVRIALGAQMGRVQRMVVAQGSRLLGVGVLIGLVASLVSTRVLDALLFGVGAVDGTTFFGMSAAMVAIGLLASYLPARRASRVEPVESLRAD